MGYYIQAIISRRTVLERHASGFPGTAIIPLTQEFALVPITDEFLDSVGASGPSGEFEKYTPAIADWLRRISLQGDVAYVEAEYFGGVGGQGSVVWRHGEQALAPVHADAAINMALRCMGVVCDHGQDEFDSLGLGRHRNVEDWLDDTLPQRSPG